MNSPTLSGSKVRKLRKYSEKTEMSLFTLEKGSKSTTISPSEFLYFELTLWANFCYNVLHVCVPNREHNWIC